MSMKFELSDEQYQKYLDWYNGLEKVSYGTTGGGYWFSFCPTGIGDIVKVRRDDGEEIDLTEEDKW